CLAAGADRCPAAASGGGRRDRAGDDRRHDSRLSAVDRAAAGLCRQCRVAGGVRADGGAVRASRSHVRFPHLQHRDAGADRGGWRNAHSPGGRRALSDRSARQRRAPALHGGYRGHHHGAVRRCRRR
ncbi:hypothetical protein OY671_011386, partial [Metschnikowia pulcherrima]